MSDYDIPQLHDLCNAWAYQVGQMSNAATVCARDWFTTPPNASAQAWGDTWVNVYATFGNVLDRANALFSDPTATSVVDGQGDVADALLQAVAPFVDLDRQLRAPGNPLAFPQTCLPTYPKVPQPQAEDWSLDVYKALTAITEPIDKVASFFESPVGVLTVLAGAALALTVLVVVVRR